MCMYLIDGLGAVNRHYQANVVISSTGEALLNDFGLAVIIEDLSKMPISSTLDGAGNPRWMAPELLVGSDIISKKSDVWAFGMVILEVRFVNATRSNSQSAKFTNYNIGLLIGHDSRGAILRTEHLPTSHTGTWNRRPTK